MQTSKMSATRPLSGGCSCGRNHYTIRFPPNASETARVFFDNSTTHRHTLASPLTSWLRIPLTWYSSTTQAYFPDETPPSIKKVYSQQSSLRNFCGFCGTPLSYWTESPAAEANYINLTLGSLSSRDLQDLEELGLIPPEAAEDAGKAIRVAGSSNKKDGVLSETTQGDDDENVSGNQGLDWFEAMVEGSRLGRANTRRLGQTRENGWRVEWEIVEWVDGEDESSGSGKGNGKRKLGEVEDIGMED